MADQSIVYTPEEALSAIGFGNFQALALVYAGLGWISEAMEMMVFSFIGIAVQSEWGISPAEESMLTTVVFVGMLFGSYFWGVISDGYGRRKGFCGVVIAVAVAAICSALSPNYVLLLIFRCLLGFGVGGGHVFGLWYLEFVPTSNRGAWVLALASFWTAGNILEAAVAWIIMPRLGWRWLVSLSCVPSLLVLLLSVFAPESPRYLSMKGRTAEAQHILEKAARMNGTKLPTGVLVSDLTVKLDEESSPLLGAPALPSAKENNCFGKAFFSSLFDLFSPKLRRTTLSLWLLYFAITFSYYGIVLLTSELSTGGSNCGLTTKISKNSQDGKLYKDVFISTLAEIPGLILSATIVDRIGRKLTMMILCIMSFILLLPLAVHQNEVVTTTLLFGTRMFVTSVSNVNVIYLREVYPTSVRSTGVGSATSIGRLGGMICPLVAVGLVRGCHQTEAIFLFEAVFVILGFCIFFLPVETSGKGLSDTIPVSDE